MLIQKLGLNIARNYWC